MASMAGTSHLLASGADAYFWPMLHSNGPHRLHELCRVKWVAVRHQLYKSLLWHDTSRPEIAVEWVCGLH